MTQFVPNYIHSDPTTFLVDGVTRSVSLYQIAPIVYLCWTFALSSVLNPGFTPVEGEGGQGFRGKEPPRKKHRRISYFLA